MGTGDGNESHTTQVTLMERHTLQRQVTEVAWGRLPLTHGSQQAAFGAAHRRQSNKQNPETCRSKGGRGMFGESVEEPRAPRGLAKVHFLA